jgi:Beta/Gamma crystallin
MRVPHLLAGVAAVAALGASLPAAAQQDSITLYEQPGYLGRSVTITDSTPNLATRQFADRARSARVVGSWTVCADANYAGACQEMNTGNVPFLHLMQLDRTIASVRRTDENEGGGQYDDGQSQFDPGDGVDGQDVTFFTRPSYNGSDVAAGTGNTKPAADAFCREAGFTTSVYAGRTRAQSSNTVNAETGARARSFALRDVVCRK